MKIKEFFTVDNGLFETIFEPNFPVLYKSIFGEDKPNLIVGCIAWPGRTWMLSSLISRR